MLQYHYTYRITCISQAKYYYGKRSTYTHPSKDLGIKYFSSSKDRDFIKNQKNNVLDFKYKILKIFTSVEDALKHEVHLHDKFNVGINPKFYNKCKQTSIKFDTTGLRYTTTQKEACSKRTLGRKHSVATKQKCRVAKLGNSWNIGRKHTKDAISKMKASTKKGKDSPLAKLVDIFDYKTNKLLASNIVLNEWCGNDKSLRSNLAATLKANRDRPSTRYNPHQSKGMYALYSNVV